MTKIKIGKRYYFNPEWADETAVGRWKTGLVSAINGDMATIVDKRNTTWIIPIKHIRENP